MTSTPPPILAALQPLDPDPARDQYLRDALAWVEEVFARPSGLAHITVGCWQNPAGTNRVTGSDQAAIALVAGSTVYQERWQLGHEAFHAVWDRHVFHWTHEAMACLTTLRRVEQWNSTYALTSAESAVRAAQGFTVADLRSHPVPDSPNPEAFYGRALLVGIELEELVGLGALADLVHQIANSPCAEHVCPDTCGVNEKDHLAREWVDQLPNAAEVRQALGYDA